MIRIVSLFTPVRDLFHVYEQVACECNGWFEWFLFNICSPNSHQGFEFRWVRWVHLQTIASLVHGRCQKRCWLECFLTIKTGRKKLPAVCGTTFIELVKSIKCKETKTKTDWFYHNKSLTHGRLFDVQYKVSSGKEEIKKIKCFVGEINKHFSDEWFVHFYILKKFYLFTQRSVAEYNWWNCSTFKYEQCVSKLFLTAFGTIAAGNTMQHIVLQFSHFHSW